MEPNYTNQRLLTTPFGMVAWGWPGIHKSEYFDQRSRWTLEEEAPLYHTLYAMKMEVVQGAIEKSNKQTLTKCSTYGTSSVKSSGINDILGSEIKHVRVSQQ